jgi:hypothetical protein
MTRPASKKKPAKAGKRTVEPKRAAYRARAVSATSPRIMIFDPADPKTVDRIRAAAEQFEKRYAADDAEAEQLRQREGIYTKDGKLTKAFSS